ncbi:MAG: late competence development ComFB family protein [Oscillatoriales cyanobacterium RM1_1_9]|nr:late competence development ComFB family protein [Oscillatoriales cyanobacterium RM1_1_9]
MGALLNGEVVAVPRKQFINVMEELVLSEAIVRVAEIEDNSDKSLDVGDVAAYALNRLPPLYATTEEGAQYQRARAREELQDLISAQVKEAIVCNLDRVAQNQTLFGQVSGKDVLEQVSSLLQAYAQDYEQTDEA